MITVSASISSCHWRHDFQLPFHPHSCHFSYNLSSSLQSLLRKLFGGNVSIKQDVALSWVWFLSTSFIPRGPTGQASTQVRECVWVNCHIDLLLLLIISNISFAHNFCFGVWLFFFDISSFLNSWLSGRCPSPLSFTASTSPTFESGTPSRQLGWLGEGSLHHTGIELAGLSVQTPAL